MKRPLLLVLCSLIMSTLLAQTPVAERYTVSGGLLGAANFSKFRDSDDEASIDYTYKTAWGAGAWVNFPVSRNFSIEPQVMYNVYEYSTGSNAANILLRKGKVNYVSIPLLFKLHAGEKIAFTLGPQLDIVSSVDDEANVANEDDFNQTSFSASGGIEVLPTGRVTIFGRYIHGFSNLDSRDNITAPMEFQNANFQLGLKLKLFGKKIEADSDGDGIIDRNDKCPNQVGVARYDGCPIPDSDNDGINDEMDKCPNQAGVAKYDGCPVPDSDNDGINDENDRCPNQAGTAKYNGCPVPDTDGDGINDENDACPSQAGPASRNGCPLNDSDNDGVPDEEDKCPTVAGVSSNNGCPDVPADVIKAIGAAGQNISFNSGNATLTTRSYTTLNRMVTIMNENPSLRLKIEGHTDNAGDDDRNMQLSEQRAEAVKAYLVSKGISEDRITTEGFGETQPIAENTTASGRMKNRRVEIKIAN